MNFQELHRTVKSLLAEMGHAAEVEKTSDTADDSFDQFRPPFPFD